MVKKKELFIFAFLILLGIFAFYIYIYINKTKINIYNGIEQNKIQNISYVMQNIEQKIIHENKIKTHEQIKKLLSKKEIREKYENDLSIILTPSIKYLYILQKDKHNRFRFLLDASKTDKSNFYQKFDVDNPKYKKLYQTKKPQVIRQKDMENLYLTYLYPIIVSNEIIAVINVDITTKINKTIAEIIKPLETFFAFLVVFIFILIFMTLVQVYSYFVTRKRIFTDPLTSLYNRNYLIEFSSMLNLKHYSIAMLDLDRFKTINDTYGHKTGDYVLAQSSKIFKNSIRETDTLIRYGGEEFLLFIYNRDNEDSALKVCERIRKNINQNIYSFDDQDINIQVSIGLHEHPVLEKNLNEAIKIADKMLYVAKSEGRNRVVNYVDSSKSTFVKTKNIDFVKLALSENRVVCFYQPIYNHLNNTIVKYEALVRIIDKDGQIISPIFFLPNLKYTNIHYKLTQRILQIVFDEFKDNNKSVSINLNFSDLINQDIENTIVNTFKTNKELASRITIEILESDEIDNIKLFKNKINLIHSLGATVSIDDFGSGYSNFKTILDIEANYLKIDGSLVKNIDINEKDFKVVKSIIHFAKEANMLTIAEFVHSKDVYDKLLKLDLDYMQGYYIAKPTLEIVDEKELFKIE